MTAVRTMAHPATEIKNPASLMRKPTTGWSECSESDHRLPYHKPEGSGVQPLLRVSTRVSKVFMVHKSVNISINHMNLLITSIQTLTFTPRSEFLTL